MGVSGLWALLADAPAGCVTRLRAEDRQLGALCAAVDGLVVAVDVSTFICHAVTQPALSGNGFSDEGAVKKVFFERSVGALRFGVTLVGVLDGIPPAEKHDRLVQRNGGKPLHPRYAAARS